MPERGKAAPVAAIGAARKASRPKRFYKQVAVKDEGAGGASLLLDGKPVRTPGKAPLILPNLALAEAIAEEWRQQRERIDPATMPLIRLANSVIDGVKGREAAVIGDILGYAGSDLVCYRAEGPEPLVALQAKHWEPVVAFAKSDLGAPMRLAAGVVHVAQPRASLDTLKRRLEGFDPFSLGALHVITGLAGSALLALAVALQHLTLEEAWAAAHVDEDWQISQWGADEEARFRRANRWRDFAAAARLLELLRGSSMFVAT
jgi:chaperone required for assembly of F1-ATPase